MSRKILSLTIMFKSGTPYAAYAAFMRKFLEWYEAAKLDIGEIYLKLELGD